MKKIPETDVSGGMGRIMLVILIGSIIVGIAREIAKVRRVLGV